MNGRRIQIPPPAAPRLMHRLAPQRGHVLHEDPLESFPEGEVQNPEACWFQHPESSRIQDFYKPERQWGDVASFKVPDQSLGGTTIETSGQLGDLRLHMPAVCLVRISAVEISGNMTVAGANTTATFTLDVGCGRALQIKKKTIQVQPADGSNDTDVFYQLPVQALRGNVSVTVKDNVGEFDIRAFIHIAPFTGYPEMIAR